MRDRLGQVTAFRVDALQSAPQTQLAPDGSRLEAYGDHWAQCERAATDILVQARKGRAFSSLDTLIAR
jgi:hypothetical protein